MFSDRDSCVIDRFTMDEPGINEIAGLLFILSLASLWDADLEEAAVPGKAFAYLSRFSDLNEDGNEP